MDITNNISEEKFLEVFKKCLKIEARTISVKTLLSERNLKRITHNPYYQRNYVWDKVKQSFFIESVILGTEIPPLIFYKSGLKIEVIDGRQRFETLKKFKENEFKLDGRGLMSLEFLAKQSFNTLDENIRDTFWSSNIRIFEFEVVNYPDITGEIEDKIKKEIFRRYNTGITPLTSSEVDNAKYIDDKLSEFFNEYIKKNEQDAKKIYNIFISSDTPEVLPKEEITNYLRRLYILDKYPISKYATGANRGETLDLLYDFTTQSIENFEEEFAKYMSQIEKVKKIYDFLSAKDEKLKNKFVYECILWAIRILDNEDINYQIDNDDLYKHYSKNIHNYDMFEYHYYSNILKRFSDTAEYFQDKYSFDYSIFLKDPTFTQKLKEELSAKSKTDGKIDQFENLRYNKPAPISTPIEEIITDVKTNRYIIRPPYQRQEKISELKSSAIIESILLGINLPPIFIFKRKDGSKEVIDGQQRLLSIIGFLGEEYKNEKGISVLSKNNNFKIKGLKILKELNGSNYSKLKEEHKEKILDFTIDLIIIEEALNSNFEPTDLFIRLNNKPYPIRYNSFEMWNSTVDSDVIKRIKSVTNNHINWFFIKETMEDPNERNDRMENEEFITTLSYVAHNTKEGGFDKIIGFFRRSESITCRLKYKTGLTDFLIRLENEAIEKENFFQSIELTNEVIQNIGKALNLNNISKEDLNSFLNISNKDRFRRSLQDFYIIWIYLFSFDDVTDITPQKLNIITNLLKEFRNIGNSIINDDYVSNFENKLKSYYN